jgi:hypothetical protein
MRKIPKRSAVIASSVAAAGVIAAGTFAYATFKSTGTAAAGDQGAEAFTPMTVTGTWVGVRPDNNAPVISTRMLPGESADVSVSLSNPWTNTVQGKVTTITPIPPTADQMQVDPADRQWCLDRLTFHQYATTPSAGVVIAPNTAVSVNLDDAVSLAGVADERCSGMKFPINFKVSFEATRDQVGAVTSLVPTAPLS